jgi:hypothetical protein
MEVIAAIVADPRLRGSTDEVAGEFVKPVLRAAA